MPFDYLEPTTAEEAVALLAQHGDEGHAIAGGTSLVLLLQQGLVRPSVLVGLRRIAGLRGIATRADGGLEIGALTTHREVERSAAARQYEPALASAFRRIATVRIRSQGTIGGNLAHADPAQDPPPILMALDATVEVLGFHGTRSIPVASLFVDYFETVLARDELILAVRLPPRPVGARARYVKFLPRTHDDYATVGVAVSATRGGGRRWTDVRIAIGAAGIPVRVEAAEAAVDGTALGAREVGHAADLVAQALEPIDDLRGSAAYKREMARVWTRRALEDLTATATTAGVTGG